MSVPVEKTLRKAFKSYKHSFEQLEDYATITINGDNIFVFLDCYEDEYIASIFDKRTLKQMSTFSSEKLDKIIQRIKKELNEPRTFREAKKGCKE